MKDGCHIIKTILMSIFCFFLSVNSYAQQIRTTWMFGNDAALIFEGRSVPVAIPANHNAVFGTSTATNCDGDLVLYSNGSTIYDASGQSAINGILDSSTSTKECIFIPNPAYNLQYYLFHFLYETNTNSLKLAYSLVDLSNTIPSVIKNACVINKNVCNKLTATIHKNGNEFWLLTHRDSTDEFIAYKIGINGLDTIPVISHCGSIYNGINSQNGQMRFSVKGNKIGLAVNSMNIVEVFDFNKQTGIVSNAKNFNACNFYYPFGIAFSQDESLLYVSTNVNSRLYQLDLKNINNNSCNAIKLDSLFSGTFGQLQFGPDGSIYVAIAVSTYIAKINNPGNRGTSCNYQRYAINLGGASCYSALPNFVQSYFDKIYNFKSEDVCFNSPAEFSSETIPETPLTITLFTGDANKVTISASDIYHYNYQQQGKYELKFIVHYPCFNDTLTDSITIKPLPVFSLGADTSLCGNEKMILESPVSDGIYSWSTGENNSVILAEGGNTYALTVSVNGCAASDTIKIDTLNNPLPEITGTFTLCSDLEIVSTLKSSAAKIYNWSSINNFSQQAAFTEAGKYTLTLTYENGCVNSRDFSIEEDCPMLLYVPSAFTPNGDGMNDEFKISLRDKKFFSINIYNRFGQNVFSSNAVDETWNGNNCPAGIYRYIINAVNDKEKKNIEGTVLLLR